ncbi:MAG TPA: XRE family transcriptional regulator [Tepidisphaeraceae bacterium]|nr:XRE family transcriptional regulator [Tepidisphaeraceae bacterium]
MKNRSSTSSTAQSNGLHSSDADDLTERLCEMVRNLRHRKGWTLERLASVSGVSRSMLSQIERNEAAPSISVAYRIARAFGVSLSTLVDAPDHNPMIDVIRLGDRTPHFRSSKDCRVRTVTPSHLEKDVEFFDITMKKGAALRSVPHFAGTREFLTVIDGTVSVQVGDERTELNRGDSAHYPADVPHAIENSGKVDSVIFLVEIYRRPST